MALVSSSVHNGRRSSQKPMLPVFPEDSQDQQVGLTQTPFK